MSLRDQSSEIYRLIRAFEVEAARFHDIGMSTMFITPNGPSSNRKFASPNHAVMLWQYFGRLAADEDTERLLTNVQQSDLQWGLRGAEVSSFGVIEGVATSLFVRMAQRAGSLFDEEEIRTVRSRVEEDILLKEATEHSSGKPTTVANNNPLAVWLNYQQFECSAAHNGLNRRSLRDQYRNDLVPIAAINMKIGVKG